MTYVDDILVDAVEQKGLGNEDCGKNSEPPRK